MPKNNPYVWRQCTKCKRILVANTKNFHKDKKEKIYQLKTICKQCKKTYDNQHSKEYYQREDIAEQRKAYSKEYHSKNKEKDNARTRKNHEKYRQNPEFKEYMKNYAKQYRQSEDWTLMDRRYKAKRRAAGGKGTISKEIELEVLNEWFNYKCAYSNMNINNETMHWDHIIPLSKNGVNEIWNIIPCYNKYNLNKNAKDPYEWYKQQDYYTEENLNYIIYYQKVMYWNFANKDSQNLVLITGKTITYEEIEKEYGLLDTTE